MQNIETMTSMATTGFMMLVSYDNFGPQAS
jgi:hypothetical protein